MGIFYFDVFSEVEVSCVVLVKVGKVYVVVIEDMDCFIFGSFVLM